MSDSKKMSLAFRVAPWLLIATKLSKLTVLAKFAKLAKPLITVVTMSISVVAYTFWLGPWLAVGFVALLFLHEMGHVVALWMRGYKAGAPVFIPFLGAIIFAPRMTSRDDEAFVGIGGPVLGGIAAIVPLVAWALIPNKESDLAVILLVTSYLGVFLNVFNLLPIRPLDGGRVTQAIGSQFKYIGLVALILFSISFREPVILLIWLFVLPEINILPLSTRLLCGCALWISMATLMALGFSSQWHVIDILDCGFGIIILLNLFAQMTRNVDASKEDDARPQLTARERAKWFGCYAFLTVALVSVMVYQAYQLPVK